jgi:hypothetical protein
MDVYQLDVSQYSAIIVEEQERVPQEVSVNGNGQGKIHYFKTWMQLCHKPRATD